MLLVYRRFSKIQKINPNEANNSDKKYEYKMWLVKFGEEFNQQFVSSFEDLEEAYNYFNTERLDPMICPPKPHSEALIGGATSLNLLKRERN